MNVSEYHAAVRSALADLPPRERDELLEDLSAHLTEVAAESDEPLEERLGSPEAYAAELQAAAGIVTRPRRARIAGQISARLRAVDRAVGSVIGYDTASSFGRLLRPGWWLLRGYLAAMMFAYLVDTGPSLGLLPRVGQSYPAAAVILAVFLLGSIWLGRRSDRFPLVARIGLGAAAVVLVLAGLVGAATADWRWRTEGFVPAEYASNTWPNLDYVRVYGPDGREREDVIVVDGNNQPIYIGPRVCESWYTRDEQSQAMWPPAAVHCPPVEPPLVTPTPTPSATGPVPLSPSPAPSPTG